MLRLTLDFCIGCTAIAIAVAIHFVLALALVLSYVGVGGASSQRQRQSDASAYALPVPFAIRHCHSPLPVRSLTQLLAQVVLLLRLLLLRFASLIEPENTSFTSFISVNGSARGAARRGVAPPSAVRARLLTSLFTRVLFDILQYAYTYSLSACAIRVR